MPPWATKFTYKKRLGTVILREFLPRSDQESYSDTLSRPSCTSCNTRGDAILNYVSFNLSFGQEEYISGSATIVQF